MNCILLRRGAVSPANITITLAGTFSSSYAYATINGTKYTAETTLEVEKGTTVKIYVSARSSSNRALCYVKLNGETVLSRGGTYNFIPTKNAVITFGYTNYGYAEITTS